MTLDIILIILGAAFIIIGILGCVLPVLPGVPLSYIGIVLLHLTTRVEFSTTFLVLWGLIVIAVQILDYYIPIWGTQKLGGGKKGAWGSAIGIVVGMFIIPPWGIIIFPFVGAVIGELMDEKEFKIALKAGLGAFLGFVAGTIMKLVVAIVLAFYFFKEIIYILIN
ncbi:DUF456 domain-containing protein [Dysgonomonas sp. Marseille-P4677]|uniref:DUF456 domain-containing protein n=1 Tax=Dysgonomonas sp. Marseille-P4677 TaxID=2364790 RepID=UPI001912D8A2|nr:DUF456 domain-containing protein [Dysgonomonas sp. Marseille-P4677]MBK5720268.1 DUF456 domain-containing protein [Dysgonomonas sp. Marseille-P4677]